MYGNRYGKCTGIFSLRRTATAKFKCVLVCNLKSVKLSGV